MPAPKGNKYNFKWTKEKAEKFFQDAVKYVLENDDVYTLVDIAINFNKSPSIFDYLIKTYKDLEPYKKDILLLIAAKTYKKALNGNINTTMAIFGLKVNFGWREVQYLEQRGYTEIKLSEKDINTINEKLEDNF